MAHSQPMSRRRRAIALGLTIGVHLIVALVVWNLATEPFFRPTSSALSSFDVAPDAGQAPQPAPAQQPEQRQQARQSSPPPPANPPPPPPKVEPTVPEYMRMTRDQFAASDLSSIPNAARRGTARTAESNADADAASGAGDSSSTYHPGAGPGGARLFNAEWVREPTDAELRTFMPPAPNGSWATIACRTIPNNRVENCQALGESPIGSKLATGLRRAAWQFLIRPPRLGGKPMVGEWVRIRIDFTVRGLEARQ